MSSRQAGSGVEDEAVTRFREYLRIPSVHPNVNYEGCVEFLKRQAEDLGLPVRVYILQEGHPIVIITWKGTEPSLPSVMLNSHMDVVPVFPEKWTREPFAAEKDENGNIYARGSQDMKCVSIQYLEAVRRLRARGVTLKRTVHMSFVPEEEVGGHFGGLADFVHTDDFKALNVEVALDEGIASPTDVFNLFYCERTIWQIRIRCPGTPGHGSLLLPNTAGEKLRVVIDRLMDYRKIQKEKLESNPELTIGDVTTINLTGLSGGVQVNVVPTELVAMVDVRLDINQDPDEFEALLNSWCKEAGEGVEVEYILKNDKNVATKLDNSNPYWVAFKRECDAMNVKIKPGIFPGGTDSRYMRHVGVKAFGFSPMNNTPVLLHDHDEFLNEDVFLRGIKIYERLVPALANV